MSKRTLTTIVAITFVAWLVGTGIYAYHSIAVELSKPHFFPIIGVFHSLTDKLLLPIFFLIFVIVAELTVWALIPDKYEKLVTTMEERNE